MSNHDSICVCKECNLKSIMMSPGPIHVTRPVEKRLRVFGKPDEMLLAMDLESAVTPSGIVVIGIGPSIQSPAHILITERADGTHEYSYRYFPTEPKPKPEPTNRTYGPTKRKKW